MSEMTFYIEEIQDGDPPPSPPPDGGESDEDDHDEEFVDLGDLTGQLEEYIKPEDGEILQHDNGSSNVNDSGVINTKKKKKKKKGKKNRGASGSVNANTGFGFGDRVELHSLVGKVELNGSLGSISSDMLPSGRFSIMLDDGSGPFDLKPTNLKKTLKCPNSQWLLLSKKIISGERYNSPPGRGGASLTLIGDKLCVFGGANRQGNHFNDVYICSKKQPLPNTKQNKQGTSSNEVISKIIAWEWQKVSNRKGQAAPKARSGHTALLSSQPNTHDGDSIVVIFGGSDLSSGVMFDDLVHMIIGTDFSVGWCSVVATGEAPSARNAHSATMVELDDGTEVMVVFGGTSSEGPTNDVFILSNPGSNTPVWSKASPLSLQPAPREMHSATLLPHNVLSKLLPSSTSTSSSSTSSIMITGGRLGDVDIASDCFVLSIDKVSVHETEHSFTASWIQLPPMPVPRCGHTTSYLNTISDHGHDGQGAEESSVLRNQSFVVVFGGIDGTAFTKETLILDTDTGKWIKKTFPNDVERLGHASVTTMNEGISEMIVFGGVNPAQDLDDVVAFIPPGQD